MKKAWEIIKIASIGAIALLLFWKKGKKARVLAKELEYYEKKHDEKRTEMLDHLRQEADKRRKAIPTINPGSNVDNRDLRAELLKRIRRDKPKGN